MKHQPDELVLQGDFIKAVHSKTGGGFFVAKVEIANHEFASPIALRELLKSACQAITPEEISRILDTEWK